MYEKMLLMLSLMGSGVLIYGPGDCMRRDAFVAVLVGGSRVFIYSPGERTQRVRWAFSLSQLAVSCTRVSRHWTLISGCNKARPETISVPPPGYLGQR